MSKNTPRVISISAMVEQSIMRNDRILKEKNQSKAAEANYFAALNKEKIQPDDTDIRIFETNVDSQVDNLVISLQGESSGSSE
jgi:hypothetical protein